MLVDGQAQNRVVTAELFEADALQLAHRRRFARPGHHRVRISQSGQLSARPARAAAHLEARRHARDSGILHAAERRCWPQLYGFYSRVILPAIGGLISGSKDAYTYLPESVRKFPDADGLADQMRDAGFVNVRFERMTAGIVALHLGDRR